MAEMGRPLTPIDWEDFEKLCAMQCTIQEIAAWFKCTEWTIRRAVKRKYQTTFARVFAEKRNIGKVSLRRAQFQRATSKNPSDTMMIWLGKQYLGQKDKHELTGDGDSPLRIEVEVVKTKDVQSQAQDS